MMRKAIDQNLFKGYKFGREGLELALLQFAYDTMFLGEETNQNVLVIKSVLRHFERMSGLKVNFAKSKLARVSLEERRVHQFATMLNCKVMHIPFIYLGLPVGESFKKASTWEP